MCAVYCMLYVVCCLVFPCVVCYLLFVVCCVACCVFMFFGACCCWRLFVVCSSLCAVVRCLVFFVGVRRQMLVA